MDNTSSKSTPKEVFWHLGSVITLYIAVISILTLLFQFINYYVPDALNPFYGQNAVRWAIAALIVVYPLHVVLARYLQKTYAQFPEKREGRLRRWLLYFTLFVAAIVLAIDAVTLIYNFLQGELSLKFFLKVLSVGVVTGGVFWYYLWDLKRTDAALSHNAKSVFYGVSVAMALLVVSGFMVAGSPFHERLVRLDNQRINDLQNIQYQVVSYWQAKEKLPATLNDLRDDISGFIPPVDPETGAPYEYRVNGPLSFELCAVFNTDSVADSRKSAVPVYYDGFSGSFDHNAGHDCFSRTIDPALYPPRKTTNAPLY